MSEVEKLINEVLALDASPDAMPGQLALKAPRLARMLKKVIEQRENLLGLLQECNVDVTELRMLFNAELEAIARGAE